MVSLKSTWLRFSCSVVSQSLLNTDGCRFWAKSKDGCRFEAEECRDLHYHVDPGPDGPTNLKDGRPTWASIADYPDYIPPKEQPKASSGFAPTLSNSVSAPAVSVDSKPFGTPTCWYWATRGKCNFSAEDCKYLHAKTPAGVAKLPTYKAARQHRDADASASQNDGYDAWGQSSTQRAVNENWRTGDATAHESKNEWESSAAVNSSENPDDNGWDSGPAWVGTASDEVPFPESAQENLINYDSNNNFW